MTRVRLKPCPRGFVVIESPYLMGERMCQKLEIARDPAGRSGWARSKIQDPDPAVAQLPPHTIDNRAAGPAGPATRLSIGALAPGM